MAGPPVEQEVPLVDAATVVLVRDGSDGDGLEVLMLERHLDSGFAPGALVFPGGKVDERDRCMPDELWRGVDPAAWAPVMGTDATGALGLLVAGVRETFEEAGILLASYADGRPVTAADLEGDDAREVRRRLGGRDEDHDWRPWLAARGLVLELGWLGSWAWWVTPVGERRRFDTRFLLAVAPPEQVAAHDEVETTDLRWLSPAAALTAHSRGDATVIYPTRCNLSALAAYPNVAAVTRAVAAGEVDRRRIEPKVVSVDGATMVQHPDGGPPEPV